MDEAPEKTKGKKIVCSKGTAFLLHITLSWEILDVQEVFLKNNVLSSQP
jgi:hypothetical protein